ncbi:hypothetical protein L9F63_024580, partial [Diploptera punctata]
AERSQIRVPIGDEYQRYTLARKLRFRKYRTQLVECSNESTARRTSVDLKVEKQLYRRVERKPAIRPSAFINKQYASSQKKKKISNTLNLRFNNVRSELRPNILPIIHSRVYDKLRKKRLNETPKKMWQTYKKPHREIFIKIF